MENLSLLRDCLEKDDYLAKIDMKDAYFSIPIAKDHRRFLSFKALGKFYSFNALSFGLCSAPRIYTKVMRPVAAFLRSLGIGIIVYLDN